VSRPELIELLNQDLSREYQAIIGYVVYSQVLRGAEFVNIAGELEKHAAQELSHALIIAKQIDYLGGMPAVEAKTVRTSKKATEMLQFDLDKKRKRFEIIAGESADARTWLNMPWANRFARS
jgi:bacterioferritin